MKILLTVASFIILFAGCAGNVKTVNTETLGSNSADVQQRAYTEEKQKKLVEILRTPPTPVRTADSIMMVLIMPYAAENNVLTSPVYKFIKMDDGQWVLGEYLLDGGREMKELKPLDHVKPNTAQQEAKAKK